jgi:hypothetical protein
VIVVSNTSPLTNLAAIGQLDLLRQLHAHIHIPSGVWTELQAGGRRWPGWEDVATAAWIERHDVADRHLVTVLGRDLDVGEAETIALALEIGADLVLLDEKEGRRAAQRLDLEIVGIVGLLIEAKASGYLDAVRPCLDQLRRDAGFYLSDRLYWHAISAAGEE